jgi:putative transposase
MGLDGKLIDELLAGRSTVAEIAGENGLLKQLTKAILERAMAAELTTHLDYEKHTVAGHHSDNSHNKTCQNRLERYSPRSKSKCNTFRGDTVA